MYFRFSRRHRRRLLLPPGLLALAGLLLVGCLAVQPWEYTLRKMSTMDINMSNGEGDFIFSYPPFASPPTLYRYSQLSTFRDWQNIELGGDSAAMLRATFAIKKMSADTINAGGVCIRFNSQATYTSMVSALDLINRNKVKQYFFDSRRIPFALYAYTNEYQIPTEQAVDSTPLDCFLCNDVFPPTPAILSFWERLGLKLRNLYLIWLPLKQPEWRTSMWLFLAIGVLSAWRMLRSWQLF